MIDAHTVRVPPSGSALAETTYLREALLHHQVQTALQNTQTCPKHSGDFEASTIGPRHLPRYRIPDICHKTGTGGTNNLLTIYKIKIGAVESRFSF